MLWKLLVNQLNKLKASFKILRVDNKKSTPVAMVINKVKDNENGKKTLYFWKAEIQVLVLNTIHLHSVNL